MARVGGGPAHVFYAPMILDDAQTAEAIRRQGDIAGAFALLPSVTIAVVAIGAWTPGLSTIYDAVTPDEREALAALGVCAELAGVFVGADGRPVPTPLDGRMIVTPGPVLERIPFVLSVAYGVAKSPAVCAAIRGRLVHGLVTHASLAREMLSARPPGGLQPPRADRRYCESGAGHPGGGHRVRPAAPCRRATHALLGHLAEVGFDGAPRVLAAGPVTETLTYIDGHAAVPPLPENTLTDSALVSVADLVRRYHLAAASFDPSGYQWPRPIPVRFRTGLVSHNDVHPANLVFRDGRAVALIDFDLAGPGSAIWDFAAAARYWAPLQDEQDITDSRQGRALERFRDLPARERAAPGRPPSAWPRRSWPTTTGPTPSSPRRPRRATGGSRTTGVWWPSMPPGPGAGASGISVT